MSITKSDLANRIHKVLGLNTRFTEATPDQVRDTLITVNDWMTSHDGIGVRLGWIEVPEDEDPDPSTDTGLPPWSLRGVVNSCAIEVSAYFDKEPSASIREASIFGMQTIIAKTAYTHRVSPPRGMPIGTGGSCAYGHKYRNPCEPIKTNGDFMEGGDDLVFEDC